MEILNPALGSEGGEVWKTRQTLVGGLRGERGSYLAVKLACIILL